MKRTVQRIQNNEQILRSTKKFAPRAFQKKLCRDVSNIIETSQVALMQAPPGTGKTYSFTLHGEYCGLSGPRVVLCGQNDLVSQTAIEIDDLQSHLGTRSTQEFHVRTWQSVVSLLQEPFGYWDHAEASNQVTTESKLVEVFHSHNLTRRAVTKLLHEGVITRNAHDTYMLLSQAPLIYLDEVHSGASGEADVFRAILALFPQSRIIGVSATPWGLSSLLFPNVDRISACYTYEDAHADGFVHDVDLIQVDTGLDVTVLETLTQNATNTKTLKASTALDMAQQLSGNGLSRPSAFDMNKVKVARCRSLFNVYLTKHTSVKGDPERALFFVENRFQAQQLRQEFVAMAKAAKRDVDIACYHGQADGDDADTMNLNGEPGDSFEIRLAKTLKAFNAGGMPDVLICVNMLVEGYNDKDLRLIFDCCFNQDNLRRAVQKIGRAMRISPDKQTSLYYYGVDLNYFLPTARLDQTETFGDMPEVPELRIDAARKKRMHILTGGFGEDRLKPIIDITPEVEVITPILKIDVGGERGKLPDDGGKVTLSRNIDKASKRGPLPVEPESDITLTRVPLFTPRILNIQSVGDRTREVKRVNFYDVFDERKSDVDAAREGLAFIYGCEVDQVPTFGKH